MTETPPKDYPPYPFITTVPYQIFVNERGQSGSHVPGPTFLGVRTK